MPRQTSMQLTPATEAQITELKRLGYGSTSAVIRTAVDRMHQTETANKTQEKPMSSTNISTFDRYAAHGTMPVDMLWDAVARGVTPDGKLGNLRLTDLIAEMHRNDPDADQDADFVAIANRMAREILTSVATAIHDEVCGCDDKRCTLPGEIRDWLAAGSYEKRPYTVAELVAEWNEYTSQQ